MPLTSVTAVSDAAGTDGCATLPASAALACSAAGADTAVAEDAADACVSAAGVLALGLQPATPNARLSSRLVKGKLVEDAGRLLGMV